MGTAFTLLASDWPYVWAHDPGERILSLALGFSNWSLGEVSLFILW